MKLINTIDAAGCVLCHDMTEIIPGKSKGTRFRRGQTITAADIPVLLNMGKEQLYVQEQEQETNSTPEIRGMSDVHSTSDVRSTSDVHSMPMLHEEEGAKELCRICQGAHMRAAPVREGKIELFAESSGLLKVDSRKLIALNSIGGLAALTLRGNRGVQEGEKVAALKIIPLFIEEEKLKRAEEICGEEKPVNIIPYKHKKTGLIITGGEIFRKRIPDTGSGILRKKIEAFPAECAETVVLPDDPEQITARILDMIARGFDLVICTGGMSVDPDDKTPLAIKNSGVRIVSYGVPFMPGFMLLLSYYEKDGRSIPVVGTPACVFYEHITALDILLPRLMADDPISREDLALLGEGGIGGQ